MHAVIFKEQLKCRNHNKLVICTFAPKMGIGTSLGLSSGVLVLLLIWFLFPWPRTTLVESAENSRCEFWAENVLEAALYMYSRFTLHL